jgi:hypothetical protein
MRTTQLVHERGTNVKTFGDSQTTKHTRVSTWESRVFACVVIAICSWFAFNNSTNSGLISPHMHIGIHFFLELGHSILIVNIVQDVSVAGPTVVV